MKEAAAPTDDEVDDDEDSSDEEHDPADAQTEEEEDLEPWSDFLQRVTHHIDHVLERYHLEDWIHKHRRMKWRFAEKTVQSQDQRWNTKLVNWRPFFCFGRDRGHPKKRWSDELEAVAGGDWMTHACNFRLWAALEDSYVNRDDLGEDLGSKARRA